MKSLGLKLVVLLFFIAVLFRLALFIFALKSLPPSSDEAWPSLMAWHILKGEFPVVYWGQSYMGTQESYLGAALIPLLGFNIITARLYPLFFAIIFCWVSYLLARKIYGQNAGLITLALLAIPVPYLAMCGALIPPDNYLAVTTLGSISLLFLSDLVFTQPDQRPRWKYILLGFILGYTFWLHILVIGYMGVALLFLFLGDKLVFLRWKFWAGVLAFCVGSLPLLWYNVANDFATFSDVGRTVDWARSWELVKELFGITIQFLVGMKVMLYGDNTHFTALPAWISILVAGIWTCVLLLLIICRFKSLLKLAILSVKGSDGTGLLLALVVATAFMFCRSTRAGWDNVRYILPMMSALPILLAGGMEHVRKFSRPVFAALIIILIGAQAWGNVLLIKAWSDPRIVGEDLELPDTGRLFAFLKEHGIRHAYAHYWLSYRMTFESQERFICSEPYNERFPGREVKFIDQVRTATNVAYIDHATLRLPEDFEVNLKAIGGEYRKVEGERFAVYYDFKPPYGLIQLKEINRAGWMATAEQNSKEAGNAIDNNRTTGWQTGRPQTAGTWFMVDMGRVATVGKIRFDLDDHNDDYPRGYKIEISTDGKLWKQILEMRDMGGNLFWEGSHPWMLVKGDFFTAAFPPIEIRYVKMTLTASDPRFDWTIAELQMFGPEK
jgi:hypothetical protein